INVEVFPNRPDMLSEQGFARAFASFIETKPGLRDYNVESSGEKIIIDKSVTDVRPFTACAIVRGLKFDDETIKEVIQLQEKLHITYGRNRKKLAIGIYPMEKINFPVTFFAEDPKKVKFQPLEYPSELDGLQILSKHPKGRDYADQLEGMDKFPFFKDADNKILSMPPIINSHDVGKIDENTKDVFIECSGFDFEYQKTGLNMIVTALADMGGKIFSLELDFGDKKVTTPDLSPKEWDLDVAYINKRLGVELTEKELTHLLAKMGHDYKNGKVLSPAYRNDIIHPVDFVEEVAIAYGYENFEPEIPDVATLGEEHPFEKFKKNIARSLTGLRLLETDTYNLTSKETQNVKMLTDLDLIELKSAVNNEYNVLRAWLIPSLMDVLHNNLNREYPQNIFGIGTVFKKGDTETGIEESDSLTVTLCDESADFTSIKQVLDYLLRMLDVKYEVKEADHPSAIPGRVGDVFVDAKRVGFVAEVHPQVLENFSLTNPVAILELDLTELFELINKK
ncbi:phenylalanine--tRNA ligase subunit beta, partial [Candidatus Woesearchaeota archaeon]|nr:phenylalanine--tRNA ligase subunit beta [Candidatus Woesearchaeota archaeon]